ncbi:phage tail tape measure protein [Streptosporangium roseum]|nr:phage tail tape measure protein [Streptosporangium roseum]
MASLDAVVDKAMKDVATSIGDGFDPTEVLADIDRMVSGFAADLDRMEAEAGAGAQGVVNELRTTLDDVENVARQAGRDGGQGLVEGLREELRDAERIARQAGDDAGREFGDGTEQTGRGRMGGIADGFMSSLKAAPWLAAGAAIGAVLMDGFMSALDAEEAKQKLYAQIGATEAEMGTLGRVAGKVYADGYGEGLGDVTNALKSVIQNIDGIRTASDESIAAVTKNTMNLASLMEEDVSRVTAAVTSMLRTGVAKTSEEAFDILAKGTQIGLNKSEDLLDTFEEYSTKFRDIGVNGKMALGLVQQMLQGGARDADVAGDALKEFALSTANGTDAARNSFELLGFDADKMFGIFSRGGPEASAAFDKVMERIQEFKGTTREAEVTVGLFGTKAEDLGDALFAMDPSTAIAGLGNLDGTAKKAGDTLHDTATNKIETWKRGLQTGVVDFLGGTVLPALENAAEGFELSGALGKVQEWAGQLGAIWDSVVADVQEWVSANQETIDGWTAKFQEGFGSISEIVDTALTWIKELWNEYGDTIITSVTFLVDTFLNIWNGFWGTVSGLVKIFKGILTGDFDSLKEGIGEVWNSLWGLVEDTITTALNTISNLAGTTWEQLKSDASAAWEKLVSAITSKVSELVADVQKLPGKIKDVFADVGTWLLQAGRDLIDGMINGVKAKAQELVNQVRGLADTVVQAVKGALDSHSPSRVFHQIGEDTVQGWIDGVMAGEGRAVKAVQGVIGKAISAANDAIGGPMASMDAGVRAILAKKKGPAVEQKIGINGVATGTAGVAMGGGGGFGAAQAQGGVTVHMHNTVIREEADVHKIGAQFGFEYSLRGAV